MSKEQDLWKELGLEPEVKAGEPVPIVLTDPATGNTVTFASQKEADEALKKMYENNLAEINKLRQLTSVVQGEPEKPAKKKKVSEEDENTSILTPEEQAVFKAKSEKDPFQGMDYYLERSPVVKELKKQLRQAEEKNEALVNSIQVTNYVTNNPALNPKVNPQAAQVQEVTGQILKAMGVEKNPNQIQLAAAAAFAKSQRPELFEFEQNGEQGGQQYQGETRYTQPSGEPQRPNNFPVPPRSGSNDYGSPSPITLLEAANAKGGHAKMRESLDALIRHAGGIDAFLPKT